MYKQLASSVILCCYCVVQCMVLVRLYIVYFSWICCSCMILATIEYDSCIFRTATRATISVMICMIQEVVGTPGPTA